MAQTTSITVLLEPDLDTDERNWLAGEGTLAAALGGERLMARSPFIRLAYERGRDDGVNYGPLDKRVCQHRKCRVPWSHHFGQGHPFMAEASHE